MRAFRQSAISCAVVGCVLLGLSITQPLFTVSAGSKPKQRGAELFAQHGCAHCHGPAGVGGGKGPDLQLVRKRMDKEQIAHQIVQRDHSHHGAVLPGDQREMAVAAPHSRQLREHPGRGPRRPRRSSAGSTCGPASTSGCRPARGSRYRAWCGGAAGGSSSRTPTSSRSSSPRVPRASLAG